MNELGAVHKDVCTEEGRGGSAKSRYIQAWGWRGWPNVSDLLFLEHPSNLFPDDQRKKQVVSSLLYKLLFLVCIFFYKKKTVYIFDTELWLIRTLHCWVLTGISKTFEK